MQDVLPAHVPIICVSKGLEVGTGQMMSEVIPGALGRKQPAVFLSGPSFAKEVMDLCPTGVVAACKVRIISCRKVLFAVNKGFGPKPYGGGERRTRSWRGRCRSSSRGPTCA